MSISSKMKVSAVKFVAGLALVLSACAAPQPELVESAHMGRLLFQDEFTRGPLDAGKWSTCYWWDDGGCTNKGNRERQWYLPENVLVEDGVLKLRAVRQRVKAADGVTYEYSSGMVTTGNATDTGDLPAKFACVNCFFEARIKLPAGQGIWPAFWLLPEDYTSKPEFDILEFLGHQKDTIHMTVHYLDSAGQRQRAKSTFRAKDFSDGWHTYAFSRNGAVLTWYIDGVQRWRHVNDDVPLKRTYVLLNLAVGGEWPGDPDASTKFPAEMQVDYIRVWSLSTP